MDFLQSLNCAVFNRLCSGRGGADRDAHCVAEVCPFDGTSVTQGGINYRQIEAGNCTEGENCERICDGALHCLVRFDAVSGFFAELVSV